MSVAVLVPYASQGCEWRDRAWGHIRDHYATHHGDWPVVVGTCDGEWSKGAAVADALAHTDAETLVIADADSWVEPRALREVVAVGSPWAMPHHRVHRLSPEATEQRYAGREAKQTHRAPYRGVKGGGITVVQREVYEACPIDPRFMGWGGEDVSWGWALNALHGPPARGTEILWHLWHPPVNVGHVGSSESSALAGRWRDATRRHPGQLRVIIDEAREALCVASP